MILNGGTLDLGDQDETVGDLSATAGTIFLGSGTLTLGTANTTGVAAVIAGAGGLIKQGSGTLTLSGASTYDGERRSMPASWSSRGIRPSCKVASKTPAA